MTIENLLLLSPLLFAVSLALYVKFRNDMDKENGKEEYTKRRLFKLTTINLFFNSLISLYFFALFLLVARDFSVFDPFSFAGAILFFFALCLSFYGNGIYIASIVIDEYTSAELREEESFDIQFLATHLFHGPVSHVLMFAGFSLAFLALIFLSANGNAVEIGSRPEWIILAGAAVGLFHALSQIYNGNALYQFIVDFGFLTAPLLAFVALPEWQPNPSLLNYFLSGFTVSQIILFLYLAYYQKRRGRIGLGRLRWQKVLEENDKKTTT